MKSRRRVATQILGVFALFISVDVYAAPAISGLSPSIAPVGAQVEIQGSGFGTVPGTVSFNGTAAAVVPGTWTDASISVIVPKLATTGNVVVTAGGVASGGQLFTVGLEIDIPRVVAFGGRTDPASGKMQITDVKAWLNFPPGTTSLGLKFTSPDTFASAAQKSWSVTLTPGMSVVAACTQSSPANAVACHNFPVPSLLTQGGASATCPSVCFDTISIIPHTTGAGGAFQFEIDFELASNYNAQSTPTCKSTQTQVPDRYTIEVTTGTSLSGACVESYDRPIGTCRDRGTIELLSPDEVFVAGFAKPSFACAGDRPPIDVVAVLDRSGSMSSPLSPAPPGTSCTLTNAGLTGERIGVLECAAKNFLDLWVPIAKTVSGTPGETDRVGVVSFSTGASSDASFTNAGVSGPETSAPKSAINALSATGMTSIGAGLHQADAFFGSTAGKRNAILLMTDGQQNTDPLVMANPQAGLYCTTASNCTGLPTNGTCAYTAANPCPLVSGPEIYTVTLGPSTGVSQAIDQQIANASLGFYLHTDVDGKLLSPFFLELLQNFLKFNSYDTVRLISDKISGTPYATDVVISATSREVEFSLMWSKELGGVRMTITPPGGAPDIVREGTSGFINVTQTLPLVAPFDPMGNWRVKLESIGPIVRTTGVAVNAGTVPFDLHIMTDDGGVKSSLSVLPDDYKVGDQIRLRAQMSFFGRPILGLGSRPGDQIFATLIAPGQGVGDLLSNSTASSTPPRPDIDPGAEAKLFNTIESAPPGTAPPVRIPLYDDGKAEHGDEMAGDGIYSALQPANIVGDYNFVFSAERVEANALRFSRQQLRSAYVRAIPDANTTIFQTSLLRRDAANTLSIVMMPRVKSWSGCAMANPKCGRMGAGWANYFWFTTPGRTPFKAIDNLNGTYTAMLSFTGTNPPAVSVHFENVLAVIGDSITADQLPVPLGPGNAFTTVPNPQGPSAKFALFLDAGAGIPHGSFGTAFNTGFSLNTGLEYIATSHLSAEGIFGYHHFPGSGGLNVYQFSGNAKIYLTTGNLRPFVNGGIGAYKFGSGSTNFGGNAGFGLLLNLTSRIAVEGSYNFHAVDTAGGATEYSSIQGGIRIRF